MPHARHTRSHFHLCPQEERQRSSSHHLQSSYDRFQGEVIDAANFTKIPATDSLINTAASLVEKHSLNATDAVILRSVLDLVVVLRATGDDLVLVTSDQRLLGAAQVEGVLTFNPETQTEGDLNALLGGVHEFQT